MNTELLNPFNLDDKYFVGLNLGFPIGLLFGSGFDTAAFIIAAMIIVPTLTMHYAQYRSDKQ